MADIVKVLGEAVDTLAVTRRHPEISDYHRESIGELTDRIRIRIRTVYPRRNEHEVVALVPKIHVHVLRMKEAVGAGDFGGVVRHGMAVMDALPGWEQSDPKEESEEG